MKIVKGILITTAVLLCVAGAVAAVLRHPAFGRKPSAARRARMEASPHWRNGRFHNEEPTRQFTGSKGFFPAMWSFLTEKAADNRPDAPLDAVKTDLKGLPANRDWLVWFGHSSYLFQLAGTRFLVDPLLKPEFPVNLMMRPFPGTDIYRPEDMPDIDVLVITHEHWDHMDYATLRDLRGRVGKVVCPLGIGEYMEQWGFPADRILEMDWYEQTVATGSVRTEAVVTCLPARHFSNRLFGQNRTLWASFMIEAGGRKVYVGGDGGYDSRFRRIRERFGRVDLAFMENGQYNDDWAEIHMRPADLEKAVLDLDARQVFTVHHDKFALARHPWAEPDSIAHHIAQKDHIDLLDSRIGEVVYY
ncbi:MAG: MBL fold metallo-hydrolase [Paludibacteraceae bacterium]|nr:MBL fold metallo-hydrolase [Paludibacteraceae bacterium]